MLIYLHLKVLSSESLGLEATHLKPCCISNTSFRRQRRTIVKNRGVGYRKACLQALFTGVAKNNPCSKSVLLFHCQVKHVFMTILDEETHCIYQICEHHSRAVLPNI